MAHSSIATNWPNTFYYSPARMELLIKGSQVLIFNHHAMVISLKAAWSPYRSSKDVNDYVETIVMHSIQSTMAYNK